jgi:hypothetical protein
MDIVRFVLPFLFVRNWHDGMWEFSRARFVLLLLLVSLFACGIGIAYMLQAPIEYSAK